MKKEIIQFGFILLTLLGTLGCIDAVKRQDAIEATIMAAVLAMGIIGQAILYLVEEMQTGIAAIIAAQISDKFGKKLKKNVKDGMKKRGIDEDF